MCIIFDLQCLCFSICNRHFSFFLFALLQDNTEKDANDQSCRSNNDIFDHGFLLFFMFCIYNNGYFESQTGEPLFLPSINPLSILLLFMVNCQGKMGHMEQNHATM